MAIVLYDLVGCDDRRFSPNCWRSRLAIAHKGLDCETRPTTFTGIADVAGGGHRTLPVIEDGDTVVAESWPIAEYLESRYPERPSLFGGDTGRGLTRFLQAWVEQRLNPVLRRLIILDVHDHVLPEDRAYFRRSREERFGATLEQVQSGREGRIEDLWARLEPARATLAVQDFLAGARPAYADYVLFGALQWARVVSPLALATGDDPVAVWFDRCLGLYDGLGRSTPGYW